MAEETQTILCPYCGHINQRATDRCEECHGLFEPLSRKATQIAMGPWYIRDARRPFRPGCSYDVLKRQALAGKLKAMTIVRGPTTRQFWALARNTPGLAHLVGYCHACGSHVEPTDTRCGVCAEKFTDAPQRNELGLLYPTATDAATAQRALDDQLERLANGDAPAAAPAPAAPPAPGKTSPLTSPVAAPAPTPTAPTTPGADLLSQVLGAATVNRQSASPAPTAVKPSAPAPAAPAAATPAVTKPIAPQAIDFDPSEDEQADTRETLRQQGKRLNSVTVLLVVSNLAVLALVVVLVLAWQKQADRQGPTHPGFGVPMPNPAPAPAPGSASAPGNAATGTPGAPGGSGPSLFDSTPGIGPLSELMAKARSLEDKNDVAGALQALQSYADTVPAKDHPAELKTEMERLRLKLKRQQAGGFFSE